MRICRNTSTPQWLNLFQKRIADQTDTLGEVNALDLIATAQALVEAIQ